VFTARYGLSLNIIDVKISFQQVNFFEGDYLLAS
jgi:hypothetical protein